MQESDAMSWLIVIMGTGLAVILAVLAVVKLFDICHSWKNTNGR